MKLHRPRSCRISFNPFILKNDYDRLTYYYVPCALTAVAIIRVELISPGDFARASQ